MDSWQPHLKLAHTLWEKILLPSDSAIDATCGNGKDTLKLAQLLPQGRIIAIDIQKAAIEETKKRLTAFSHIEFHCQSHEKFPTVEPVKLIIYNLGYLPGGNKSFTTLTETTLKSLSEALQLILPGGALSITCYPGHPEGAIEEKAIFAWVSKLDSLVWDISIHQWLERRNAPSLIFIQKISRVVHPLN